MPIGKPNHRLYVVREITHVAAQSVHEYVWRVK